MASVEIVLRFLSLKTFQHRDILYVNKTVQPSGKASSTVLMTATNPRVLFLWFSKRSFLNGNPSRENTENTIKFLDRAATSWSSKLENEFCKIVQCCLSSTSGRAWDFLLYSLDFLYKWTSPKYRLVFNHSGLEQLVESCSSGLHL